jgi:hypothetical protein
MSMLQRHETMFKSTLERLTITWVACLVSLHATGLYGQSAPTPDASSQTAVKDSDPTEGEWIQLFNGKDINDWIVKLNRHEINDNYRDTFRVEDGLLKVRYDQYEDFGDRFGHLYYKQPFSHYHLAVEYRFVGKLHRGAPGYAVLNSGVMLHSQDPNTILRDQNWPISIELQFLAGLPDGKARATGNVCTPGTHVFHNGKLTQAHIIQSSAQTYKPEQWVRAEAIVRGNDSIVHLINGEKVLEYSRPQIGGGVVAGYDPHMFQAGKALSEGTCGDHILHVPGRQSTERRFHCPAKRGATDRFPQGRAKGAKPH